MPASEITPPTGANPVIRRKITRRSDISLVGIYEISKLLTAPSRLEATLARVLQLLASFLEMRHGLIAILGENGVPETVVGSGWNEAIAKRYFDRLPERAIGQIVVTKMPLVIEHMRRDPLFKNWDFSEWVSADSDSSFIGVPIKDRGKVIGTLTIDREHDGVPDFSCDEDVRFLTMVASLLGQTVRLQRLIARDRERLMDEQRRLEKTLEHSGGANDKLPQPTGIIGQSPAIGAVLDKIRKVARSHSPVLLRGESGTGKELFAHALHELSPRAKGPFVAVNCAALAESVLESELFGHEKGAFTGAIAQRKGRFEQAHNGTLFLDEIGEISPSFQAKLLRVLQQGEFERVGGNGTIKVNVRLVAATNRNLEETVAKGQFRADLYYRISVVPILLPPLRERKSDIAQLANEFLRRFNTAHETSFAWSEDAMAVLTGCYFPGNVRELENCVQRTATLARGPQIGSEDFACQHDECLSAVLWNRPAEDAGGVVSLPVRRAVSDGRTIIAESVVSRPEVAEAAEIVEVVPSPEMPQAAEDRAERMRLIEAMETAGWVQAKAARLLGLSARQIGYALRKHNVSVKKF